MKTFRVVAALLLAASLPAAAATKHGKGVSDGAVVQISELMAKPDQYVGKTVKVQGVILEVCPMAGCWIEVAGDGPNLALRVKVEDGVIVFPTSDKGKKVVAEGVFTKIELSKERAIERLKHEAEEKGQKFDPASVKGPMTVYQIQGVGAVVE